LIVLKSLKLNNFKSWKNLEIDNIDNLGLTLINAKNGFGKSSIRNAIEYLLLDTFSEPMNVDDIPFNRDTECTLEGVFQKDKDTIKIIKYRNHKKKGQTIELWLNDDDSLTHTDRRETQKEILRLFNIDLFTVQTTSIYSSNSKSFIKSTDSEKKEIIYNVCNLHKFTKGKDRAKQKIKELTSVIEQSDIEIKTIKETIEAQRADLEDVIGQIDEFEAQKKQKIETLELSIRELQSGFISDVEIDELQESIITLQNSKEFVELYELESLEDSVSKLKESILTKEIELKNLLKTKQTQEQELVSITEKLNNYNKDKSDKIQTLLKAIGESKSTPTTELKDKINTLEQQKLLINEDTVSMLECSIEDYKTEKFRLEIELKNNRKKLKESGDGICPVLKNFQCKHLVEQREKIVKSCEPVIANLENDIKEINSTIETAAAKLQKINNDIQVNIEIDAEIADIQDNINTIETNNLITDNKIRDTLAVIKNLRKEKNPYIDLKNNINIPEESTIRNLKQETELLSEELTEKKQRVAALIEIHNINNSKDKEIQDIQNKINDIINNNKIVSNKIQSVKDNITTLQTEQNPYTKFKKKIDRAIKLNTEKVRNAESKNSQMYDELLYYRFWYTGFGKTGLPNMLAEDFLISLEDETNKILSSISDQMYITISSQKENKNKSVSEKIDVQIHHPDKTITSVGAYSAGQRQRVKIANLFALHHLISNLDFMILDESLEGSLDQEGKESIIELLKKQVTDVNTILVISHDDTVKNSFDNIIDIGMENGVSYIKE